LVREVASTRLFGRVRHPRSAACAGTSSREAGRAASGVPRVPGATGRAHHKRKRPERREPHWHGASLQFKGDHSQHSMGLVDTTGVIRLLKARGGRPDATPWPDIPLWYYEGGN
jgi:hypothetical protein